MFVLLSLYVIARLNVPLSVFPFCLRFVPLPFVPLPQPGSFVCPSVPPSTCPPPPPSSTACPWSSPPRRRPRTSRRRTSSRRSVSGGEQGREGKGSRPDDAAAHCASQPHPAARPVGAEAKWTLHRNLCGACASMSTISVHRRRDPSAWMSALTVRVPLRCAALLRRPSPRAALPPHCRRLAGNSAFAKGDHQGAIAAFTEALTFDPNNVALLSNRSAAYAAIGQCDRDDSAPQPARRCIMPHPCHPRADVMRSAALGHARERMRTCVSNRNALTWACVGDGRG